MKEMKENIHRNEWMLAKITESIIAKVFLSYFHIG